MKKKSSYLIEKKRTAQETTIPLPPQKDIVIYSSPFCGYCKRLKSKLEEHQLLKKVLIIEDDLMIPDDIKRKGLPLTVSKTTNETYLGFPSDFDMYKKRFFNPESKSGYTDFRVNLNLKS